MTIRVLLNGATGKMGRSMAGFILADPELELAAAVDVEQIGCDAGCLSAGADCGVVIESDLAAAIGRAVPDVMLDFTEPDAVRQGVVTALSRGVACVVGTTGLSDADLQEIDALARAKNVGAIVSPNFALSAVLMARFAAEAV